MNEAEELKKLLSNDLAFVLPGVLILQRLVWLNFFESAESESIPRKWFAGVMLLFSMGVAYANFAMHAETATSVAQLWWMQGLIFWGGLLAADFLLEKAYRSPRPEGSVTASSKSGGYAPAIAIALLVSTAAGVASAATPPLSILRLSGGLAAQAAAYTGSVSAEHPAAIVTFAPKAWLSYSLLEEVSLHASGQWGLKPRIDEYHAGGSVRLLKEDPVRVAVGVDQVWYERVDPGGIQSATEYSLRFSKVLKRAVGAPRLGVQYQIGWIPAKGPPAEGEDAGAPDGADTHEFTHRIGINWHAFGGRWIP